MGKEFSENESEAHFESSNDSQNSSDGPPESLLNEVLENTIPTESEPLAPEELAAMQTIARQFSGQPLWLEPIGVALVESLLKLRMPAGVQSMTPEMAQSIAEAMFESPECKARLDNLWNQLCESVR